MNTVAERLSREFWRFFSGQSVSNLGNAFSKFAVPLLVYDLTGSALHLAVITATQYVPYLCFGLVIGAWVDRTDRKRLMVIADVLRAVMVLSLPALWWLDMLPLWWVYTVAFVSSTLGILFNAAEFAAIPSMVPTPLLATANGRIQASYSLMNALGPLLAGSLRTLLTLPVLFVLDAFSYLFSAFAIGGLKSEFRPANRPRRTFKEDILEGLQFVFSHPTLRSISLLLALLNFLTGTTSAQLVLYGKQVLHASDFQLGVLFASGSLGVVGFSLLAGWFNQRFKPGHLILGTVFLQGVALILFALSQNFWLSAVWWAIDNGLIMLCAISARVLRQSMVPSELLGRVVTVAEVLAWSAIPLGGFLGAYLVEHTHNINAVYLGIGIAVLLLSLPFLMSPLGRPALKPQEAL
ncbi:MFS transporter [Deinococcus roseus]|uniref:MFS transporter n=1 Tax=Deinococcus roseus TaxID=392414 RepID=A0ABQ2DC29_9DEIO|nr:MFS transporter [Deinococcus roseus]GGJ52769.1 MFS transporter [Deinococcus roseus]